MKNHKLLNVLDKVGIGLVLLFALLLRSNLSYRTAFIDEAMNIFYGQEMLQGHPTYIQDFHMGFAAFTQIPMALADQIGGLEFARGLSVVLGLMTVLFVMLTARKVYGKIAGFIAGGIVAAYAPAIFTSTFAHYDAWSTCFASLAVYLWVVALVDNKDHLLALGSLAMVLAMLAKYTAVVVAASAITYGIVLAILVLVTRKGRNESEPFQFSGPAVARKLLFGLLPFLLVLVYLLFLKESLVRAWQTTIITRHAADPITTRILIVRDFAYYIWLPFLVSLPALFWRKKRAFSVGLLVLGLSAILYHLFNNDTWQIHKHSIYMAANLAILASGSIALAVEELSRRRLSQVASAMVAGAFGLVMVAYLAIFAQSNIAELRTYWPDTTELMAYLRENVQDGDEILMEAGDVGRYYLITRGFPGHIPQRIVDTWYYKDELGEGLGAYQRSIEAKKFAFIVFSNLHTPELNRQLLEFLQGRYQPDRSFQASIWYSRPNRVQFDVYRLVP
mgnify:CR=1 FL=1